MRFLVARIEPLCDALVDFGGMIPSGYAMITIGRMFGFSLLQLSKLLLPIAGHASLKLTTIPMQESNEWSRRSLETTEKLLEQLWAPSWHDHHPSPPTSASDHRGVTQRPIDH